MKCVLTAFTVLCLLSAAAFGQTITGSVTGTVADPSGAVIPGARVVVTNTSTNLSNTAESNSAGVYNLLFLPIGSYSLNVEAAGFKKVVLASFRLETDQVARIDIKMEVGEVTQSVEIRDVAPILQTENTQTGGLISANSASSLPIAGRNFTALTLLIPGSVTPSGTSGRPYTNGNREQTNNFMLDGIDINETIDNGIAFNPNLDAIAEIKISTGNASAEFGNANGSMVSMALKSGTNGFHGNAFEYLRNDKLDANAFFRNRSGQPRNPVRQNVFGGTLGGPIVKNRTFFFVDWEGRRNPSGGTSQSSVALAEYRTGNLSRFPQAIRDPLKTGACTTADRTACFTGNVIPQSRIVNPVALKLFSDTSLYPLPNNVGTGNIGVQNNYVSSNASIASRDQGDVKIDHRLSDKDNLSGRLTVVNPRSATIQVALPTSTGTVADLFVYSSVINWTRTISASMVNEFRIGFNRPNTGSTANDPAGKLGLDGNAKFGIPGGQPIVGLSSITLGDGMTALGNSSSLSQTTDNTFQYSDNLSFQRGRHNFKTGFQFLRYQQNRFYGGNNGVMGLFVYDQTYTGSAYADFLLDQLRRKGRGSLTGRWGHRQWRPSVFFQDDFKAKSNLTLNLGMRWEYTQPVYEVADRQSNIDLTTGKQLFAGKDGNSRALYRAYYKQFEPRVGFAWTPGRFGNKLVVRGAYGITSFMEGTGANLRLPLNPPFFFESDITYDANAPGSIARGFTDATALSTLSGQPRAWNPDLRPAFTQQWNFTLEYQLAPTLSLSAGYVGQKGTQLVNPREYNQPLPGVGPVSTWAPAQQRRPLNGVLPAVTNISGTDSSSTMYYNSLQVSARKRLSHGLEFQASYTFSRVLTDNRGYYGNGGAAAESAYWQNANDRRGDWGVGFFNATHIFSMGGHYDLPVGRNRAVGRSWGRALDMIAGGWGADYILQVHSGFPISLQSAGTAGGQDVRVAMRPNRYKTGFDYVGQSIDSWFGTGATAAAGGICATAGVNNGTCVYGIPDAASFGSSAKATEFAPAFFSLDFSVAKQFKVTESKYFLLRGQFYNLPNTPSFGNPGRSISTPTTFGLITGTSVGARTGEIALKFYF